MNPSAHMLNRGPLTRDYDLRFAHLLSQKDMLPLSAHAYGNLLRKCEFEDVNIANLALPLWGQDDADPEEEESNRASTRVIGVSLKVATTFMKVWAEICGEPNQIEPFDEYILRVRKEWQAYKTAALFTVFYAQKPVS